MGRWAPGFLIFIIFILGLFNIQAIQNRKSTDPIGEKAKITLQALENGNFDLYRANLSKSEPSQYGLSENQFKVLFNEYLAPAYAKIGTGDYQIVLQLETGSALCRRGYSYNGMNFFCQMSVGFRESRDGWGYYSDLTTALVNAWAIRGISGNVVRSFYEQAKADRILLEKYGITKFPAADYGHYVTWDQQLSHLQKVAAKNSAKLPK